MSVSMRFGINQPEVVSETIDGEAVIIHLITGSYYSLSQVGTAVWSLLEAGVDSKSIVNQLTRQYDASAEDIDRAIAHLLEQLQQEALIEPLPQSAEISPSAELANGHLPDQKQPFEAPILQKYTDMQDLLLLDPIHEVEETGWPNKKVEVST